MLEIAILKNFDSGTYKAGVQLAGSLTTYFDDISVAKNIPSSALVIGNYVILAIPGGNPKDACVIATWPQGSPGGGAGSFLDLSDTPSSYSGQADKVPRVNSGESALEFTKVTYDLAERFLLSYLIYRGSSRFMHIQFDSYDMISEYVSGSGIVWKNFFSPIVRSGSTSGGKAALYQNTRWLYASGIFIQQGKLKYASIDGTGFLGMALNDNHIIALNDTTKHVGFIFYISGATETVYASNANGTTQTKTDLSLNPAAFATWAMIIGGGQVEFYRDWVLQATHTTNLPSGTLGWKICVVNAENSDQRVEGRNLIYSLE